ncbi:MAG: LEA type 2 family protein [Flavobacteriales bacterium]|nr:LEA type 2 family protein [Flavobacteriales bacterium]
MKKWIALIVVIIVVIALAKQFTAWNNARISDPNASFILPDLIFADVKVTKLTKEEVVMECGVLIRNPAPLGFAVDSIDYTLSIAGVQVLSSTNPHELVLKGRDSTVMSMPITIEQDLLIRTLDSLDRDGTDSVIYAVDMEFMKSMPLLGKRSMSFHVERSLPVFVIPQVEMTDMHLSKVGLKDTRLSVDLLITNPNNFQFAISDTKILMHVGSDRLFKAAVDSVLTIPANGHEVIVVPLQVDLGEGLGTVMKFMFKPGTPYVLEMDTRMESRSSMTDGTRVHVELDGALKELKEMR